MYTYRTLYFLYGWGVMVSLVVVWGCVNKGPGRFDQQSGRDTLRQDHPGVLSNDITTFTPEERHIWQKPEVVLSKLGDLKGKTVADIGAGTGYFSYQFLTYAAKVIAVDVDPKMVRLMNLHKKSLPDSLREKFEARLCKEKDPLLADGEVDVVFMANVYPYLRGHSISYLKHLARSLQPGGTLMIIDFKKKHTDIGPPLQQRVALGDVEENLLEAGFEIVDSDDRTLNYQYMILARRE